MRILNRYIASHVISATALVVLVLVGVESFMLFVGQLSDMGQAHYGLLQSMVYVGLSLPSNFYQLFPMAGLLGCLLGLGRLASTSQLVVMQTAGVSVSRITLSVIQAAILMLIVVTIIGEVLAPRLQHQADDYKAVALNRAIGLHAFGGTWLHDGRNFVYLRSLVSQKALRDVTVYSFSPSYRLMAISYAKRGNLVQGRWQLSYVTRTIFSKQKVRTYRTSAFWLNLDIKPNLLALTARNPQAISLAKIREKIQYLKSIGLSTSAVAFAFWQRMIQPLTTIVMIALGVPFIFGSLRSVSTSLRIVIGIVIGFGFYILNQFFGPLSMLFQFPPFLAAIAPTIIFAIVCFVLLRKIKH